LYVLYIEQRVDTETSQVESNQISKEITD